MRWSANDLVEETIRTFCRDFLEDAHNLEDLSYAITPVDGLLRVEVDVPTSEMDAWATLMVDVSGEEPRVVSLSCLRSGTGDHCDDVYEWTSETRVWTLKTE